MSDSVLPTDSYSRELARLRSNPAVLEVKGAAIEVADVYGKTETWIVATLRVEDGDTTFLQRNSAEGGARFVLPPRVMNAIAGQRLLLTTRSRRRGARAAVATKREKGVQVGNPAALAKARRAKK